MTPFDIAELLDHYAAKVVQLPGVSRTNPHAFAEAKSELACTMRANARNLRTSSAIQPKPPIVMQPGLRTIGDREVKVERRQRFVRSAFKDLVRQHS